MQNTRYPRCLAAIARGITSCCGCHATFLMRNNGSVLYPRSKANRAEADTMYYVLEGREEGISLETPATVDPRSAGESRWTSSGQQHASAGAASSGGTSSGGHQRATGKGNGLEPSPGPSKEAFLDGPVKVRCGLNYECLNNLATGNMNNKAVMCYPRLYVASCEETITNVQWESEKSPYHDLRVNKYFPSCACSVIGNQRWTSLVKFNRTANWHIGRPWTTLPMSLRLRLYVARTQ